MFVEELANVCQKKIEKESFAMLPVLPILPVLPMLTVLPMLAVLPVQGRRNR